MNGDVIAIRQYANILMYGEGVEVNQQKAVNFFKLLADRGDDLDSIIKYAKMLFNGEGIEANLKESIRYFKIAAQKGSIEAQKIVNHLTKIKFFNELPADYNFHEYINDFISTSIKIL